MNKFLIFLILLSTQFSLLLFGEDFKLSTYVDSSGSLDIRSVQEKKFTTSPKLFSQGFTQDIVWNKIELKSTSDERVFLHNGFAYNAEILSIYEFDSNSLIHQKEYNLFNEDKLIGNVFVYPMQLKANITKTLYIKTKTSVIQIFNYNIYKKKEHIEVLINKNIYSNIIVFILLVLAFYNVILYIFNKKKEFIYYSLYLFNSGIGLSYMYGTLYHNLGLYGEFLTLFNLTAIFVPALLVLFIQSIFKFKGKMYYLYKQMQVLYAFTAINTILAIFLDIQLAVNISALSFLLSFIIIIQISIILYKQKHPLVYIFIIAYLIYIIGFTLTILALQNLIVLSIFTFHASGIALIIEAFLFSYLLHYHTTTLQKKLVLQQNQIILKNQKAQMGGMIGAITHQWKQPLTTVSSILMLIRFKIESNEVNIKELEEKIIQMETNIYFLSETIDDFRNFFSANKVKTECDVEKLILRAIHLSSDEVMANNIKVTQELNFSNKTLKLYENELLHIILNIIQNAKEAFTENNHTQENKNIKIIGNSEGKNMLITIIDNAGGISDEKLPLIFAENYTTKENGTGLGLYLSKVIIEDHMGGSIEAKNIGDGTMFRIKL